MVCRVQRTPPKRRVCANHTYEETTGSSSGSKGLDGLDRLDASQTCDLFQSSSDAADGFRFSSGFIAFTLITACFSLLMVVMRGKLPGLCFRNINAFSMDHTVQSLFGESIQFSFAVFKLNVNLS